MAWSGGTYTKPLSWTANTTISAADHNTQDADFTTGINSCLVKDGTNSMTANLNFGGFRPSNVAAGSAATCSFAPGGSANTGMFLAATNELGFSTNGVERLRISDTGEVGIAAVPGTGISVQVKGGTANVGGHSGVSGFFAADTGAAQNAGVILGSNNGTEPYVAASKLGNGTDTPLAFYTATTEKARILPNGNFGVGTTNPTAKLQVDGTVVVNANSASEAFRITQTGAGKAFVVEDSANPDTSPFVIATNGQVGVGISDPTAVSSKLYVNGELYGTDVTAETVVATTIVKSAGVTLCPEYVGGAFSNLPNASATTGVIRGSDSDGTVSNAGGGTLSIAGGKATGNAAGGPIIFSTSVAGASGTSVQSLAERMRIGSDGIVTINSQAAILNVGSNNTSTQDCVVRIGSNRTSDGNSYLEMATDTVYGFAGLQLLRTAGANASSILTHRGTGGLLLNCKEAGTIALRTTDIERMRVTSAGVTQPGADNSYTLGATGARWSAVWAANGTIQTSDLREKNSVTDSVLGLTFVKSLRPVSYKWNVGGNLVEAVPGPDGETQTLVTPQPGTRTHWGLIAQEVKAAVDAAGVDFGGWVLSDKNDPDSQQALRYDQFVAPLIQAVKELAAKVEALETQVAGLVF